MPNFTLRYINKCFVFGGFLFQIVNKLPDERKVTGVGTVTDEMVSELYRVFLYPLTIVNSELVAGIEYNVQGDHDLL